MHGRVIPNCSATWQDQYKTAFAKQAKEAAKLEAKKLKGSAEGENSSVKLEKDSLSILKSTNFRDVTNANVAWNIQLDHHELPIA